MRTHCPVSGSQGCACFCKNAGMAIPPIASTPPAPTGVAKPVGKTRTILLFALTALLLVCLGFLWTTRGAMENLSFVRQKGGSLASTKAKKDPCRCEPVANRAGACRARGHSRGRQNTPAMPSAWQIMKWIRLLPRLFVRQHSAHRASHPHRRCPGALAKDRNSSSNSSCRIRRRCKASLLH